MPKQRREYPPCNVNCHSRIVKANHIGELPITRWSSALLRVLASLMAEGSKDENRLLSACFIDCVFAVAVHKFSKNNSSQNGSWPPINGNGRSSLGSPGGLPLELQAIW